MQDNEFEKQVRDKLARMQMEASDTVWQRVEDGLTEQRKRRRWLIWIPVSAVLLLTGFFVTGRISEEKSAGKIVQFVPGSGNQKTIGAEINAQKPETKYAEPLKIKESEKGSTPVKNQENARGLNDSQNLSDGITIGSASKTNSPKVLFPLRLKNTQKSLDTSAVSALKQVPVKSRKLYDNHASPPIKSARATENKQDTSSTPVTAGKVFKSLPPTPEINQVRSEESKKQTENIPPAAESDKVHSERSRKTERLPSGETTNIDSTGNLLQANATDSISYATVRSDLTFMHEIRTVDALNQVSLPVLTTKAGPAVAAWRWGLIATVGRSGITTGKFNALFYSDVASAPNYSAGNLGNAIVIRPSQVKPATSMSISGYAEYQVETSMYFKSGIQLSRFSTTMLVGSFKPQSVLLRSTANMADKAIASYYTAEQTQRYTNAYTFIDIPLSLGFNFATRTRLPFAWEIGVAPSFMLGSNALHFNQGSSIYYKDNSLFKKSQAALVTSIPLQVYNGNKYTLLLVPGFRYNTSNLFLPEINEKKHLLSAGIGLSVKFKK